MRNTTEDVYLRRAQEGRKEAGSRPGEEICQSLANLGDLALQGKKKKNNRKPGRKPRPK